MYTRLFAAAALLVGAAHDPLPSGWSARADNGKTDAVKFAAMGPGWHVSPGEAAILWRAADTVAAKFHTLATFSQTKAPTHPEAYGLFVGGQDLAGAGQRYIYFLVRGDGAFLVKRRDGDKTTDLSKGWTPNAAVVKAGADGKATNKIEVAVIKDQLTFMVNGTTVWEAPAKDVDTKGAIGLRVNHGLDVHIAGFDVHRIS